MTQCRGDLYTESQVDEETIFSQKGHYIPLLLSAYKVLWELVVVWWSSGGRRVDVWWSSGGNS